MLLRLRRRLAKMHALIGAARAQAISWWLSRRTRRTHWAIGSSNGEPVLTRNGGVFRIRGASAWLHESLEDLAAIGANAVRGNPDLRGLNKAAELGLAVFVNLSTLGEKDGFNWDNAEEVHAQKQRILKIVRALKNHPAVMIWSVGNELEWHPSVNRRMLPHHEDLWKHVDDLAKAIKQIDPHHPTAVCTCREVQDEQFGAKIHEIMVGCPHIDVVGVNAFWELEATAEVVRSNWRKPFVFAEWGAAPPWHAPKTSWRAPLEPTSSQKAAYIADCYDNVITRTSNCAGSFLFFWGERPERTHTWFGLLRDGMKTEPIDIMRYKWTGTWPENRSPGVLGISIQGDQKPKNIQLDPDTEYKARVHCYDPEDDKLEIGWHIRPEVIVPRGSFAGDKDIDAGPLSGLILDCDANRVRFTTPKGTGPYRLYVQVTDGNGNAGYGNVPFWVRGEEG